MIKIKFRSKSGATLIFALVALLVATMVSAVIIYAAESNAKRIRSAQEEEQAELTLNSAASLVRNEIAGSTYYAVRTVKSVVTEIPDAEGKPTGEVTYSSSVYSQHKYTLSNGSAFEWTGNTGTPNGGSAIVYDDAASTEANFSSIGKVVALWLDTAFKNEYSGTTTAVEDYVTYITADNMDTVCAYLSFTPEDCMISATLFFPKTEGTTKRASNKAVVMTFSTKNYTPKVLKSTDRWYLSDYSVGTTSVSYSQTCYSFGWAESDVAVKIQGVSNTAPSASIYDYSITAPTPAPGG